MTWDSEEEDRTAAVAFFGSELSSVRFYNGPAD